MKKIIFIMITLLSATNSFAETFSVSFADAAWDGLNVPKGQQCQKFGGSGYTPALKVEDIPKGVNAIVMEYSDETYKPMNNGGHGKIGFRLKKHQHQVIIPSVKGHVFKLPKHFYLIEAQRAPSWDKAGAYLPPCSGGAGNSYVVKVRAVHEVKGGIKEVLAEKILLLGKY